MPEPSWLRFYADGPADEDVQAEIREAEAMRQAVPFLRAMSASLKRRAKACRWQPGLPMEQAAAMQIALSVYSDLTDWVDGIIKDAGG